MAGAGEHIQPHFPTSQRRVSAARTPLTWIEARAWRKGYGVAMANRLMTLDLFATLDIVEDDVSAVVNAYMAGPTSGSVSFGECYQIDPSAAVAAHPFANTLIGQPWASLELRRAAVRAAILLAQPERV